MPKIRTQIDCVGTAHHARSIRERMRNLTAVKLEDRKHGRAIRRLRASPPMRNAVLMTEQQAAQMLDARADLFTRAIGSLAPPPRSSLAEHQQAVARAIRAKLPDDQSDAA